MNPITDRKPVRRVFRVVDIDDKNEPYALLNAGGDQIRTDRNPRRLVDYALDSGQADDVRHDYDMVKEAQR